MRSESNSHIEPHDLRERILFKMRSGDTQGQLRRILKNQFLKAMAEEATVLNRNQREQLFADVARTLLNDTSEGFDEPTV